MQSGVYNYFLNSKPTGVTETFDIKILSDGSKFTTSTRDAKPYKTLITVETTEKNGKFQNCKINFQKDELQVEAVYEFAETTFHILRKIKGKVEQDETLDLPENSIFFPLMRCFQGQTILQVAKNQGFTNVIVPDIQTSTDFENLLKPSFDERTAQNLGKEAIAFYQPESITIETNYYRYLSKHYDENSQFWIDDNGLLIAYRFQQSTDKIWEIFLESALRIPQSKDRPTVL